MKRLWPILLCSVAFAGEVPRPTDTPELDKAMAEAEDALVIHCARLSRIVYVEDLACQVCELEGPLKMAFICVAQGH